jgi:hypothetical protein
MSSSRSSDGCGGELGVIGHVDYMDVFGGRTRAGARASMIRARVKRNLFYKHERGIIIRAADPTSVGNNLPLRDGDGLQLRQTTAAGRRERLGIARHAAIQPSTSRVTGRPVLVGDATPKGTSPARTVRRAWLRL